MLSGESYYQTCGYNMSIINIMPLPSHNPATDLHHKYPFTALLILFLQNIKLNSLAANENQ
jgi:hypothetical protein